MTDIRQFIDDHYANIIRRDLNAVLDHYADDPDLYVHLEGPRWSNRGFANIKPGWEAFFQSPLSLERIDWVEGPIIQQGDTLACAGGIVEIGYRVREKTGTLKLRGTLVMRKDADGAWRVIHEHFSQPLENPYGFGDWMPESESTP